jgi:hypothetical protein
MSSLTGALLLAAAAASPAAAESGDGGTLDVRLDLRLRGEAISGQFRPGRAGDDALISLRTNLFAEYDAGPIRIGGELLDARGYGEKRNSSVSTSEVNALEPLQAYVAADLGDWLGKGNKGLLKAGRFTLEIGSARLVGRPDSSNAPPSYTGAAVDLTRPNKDRLVLFWTMPNLRLPADTDALRRNRVKWDRSTADLRFFGGSYSRASLAGDVGAEAYAYRLAEGDAAAYPTRNRRLTTFGLRIVRKPGKGPFDFDLEAARQTGSARASSAATDRVPVDVRSGFAHAEVGRKLAVGWTPRISAMVDYATGDDSGSPHRNERFDPLFGARRADLGYTGLYGLLSWANLVSVGGRIEAKPNAGHDVFLAYRANWLDSATDSFAATSVRDRLGGSGRCAGHQVETRLRQQLVKDRLKLELGGIMFAKERFLRDAANAPQTGDTLYGYASLYASF